MKEFFKNLAIEYYKDFYARTCIFALILSGVFYGIWELLGIRYDEVFLFGYSLGFAIVISSKIESLITDTRIKKLEDIITNNETDKIKEEK